MIQGLGREKAIPHLRAAAVKPVSREKNVEDARLTSVHPLNDSDLRMEAPPSPKLWCDPDMRENVSLPIFYGRSQRGFPRACSACCAKVDAAKPPFTRVVAGSRQGLL